MLTAQLKSPGFDLVIQSATELPQNVKSATAAGLRRGLAMAVEISQREYLQGPRPQILDQVTTRLRQSISSEVTEGADSLTARIGTDVVYGRFHEFGFYGVEKVRGFTRIIERETGLIELFAGRNRRSHLVPNAGQAAAKQPKAGAPSVQFVRPHERHVNYAGRPFITPALQRAQPLIIEEINKELSTLKRK